MHYALRLAEEQERNAKQTVDRAKRQFAAQYSRLEQRARSAEKNAERAEGKAAEAEGRVSKSLQALRVLRCRLMPYAPDGQAKARTVEESAQTYSQASLKL
jgi:dsDNA-specific endonuclease/ATPase MutS2